MSDARGVKWYGADFDKKLNNGVIKNLTAAGKLVQQEVKQELSQPGRKVETVVSRTGKTRKKYGKKGELVSAPGEPPRKQKGDLLRSVKRKLFRKKLKVRITDQGRVLEFGDDKMKARPHLRTALERMKSAVAAALATKVGI